MTETTPDYSPWIGRAEAVDDVASRAAVVQLAALLDRPVAEDGIDTAALTPTGHWLQFTPTAPQSELGTDGHPRLGGFMPPLDLPRRMWAGSTIDFTAPIRVGQRLRKTSTIESITPKSGSSGRLCFVVLRHDVEADGVHALTERQTIVYREAVAPDPAAGSPRRPPREATDVPEGWDWSQTVVPDERLLFRFSAVTFNTHRIHYDLPYATEVEGYPGLVVHGPLSATLIVAGFRDNHPGAEITRYEFTARSPIFAGEQLHVVGRAAEDGAEELAVIAPGGQTAVAARIAFR
ncbi:FAS1-like dehydratase domain-containing protein [Microbacterium sp. No. 7]|uniref:FAS1-like dehydratase domain-containing protein n=1 Tax=Microbacterium sp. No. 7 TaxID=1714373 RepID=UPI0006D27F93|nr:MaoC family dehydratase N-terminal domain-containing protein [Microbacterium sp. No. 7]ALJ19244.1 hypothetical protein AOA12_04740 [Microbacterium sp. No. 7]